MNKKDLAIQVRQALANSGQTVPATACTDAVEAVFKGMTSALVKGEKITLRGFGTFRVKGTKARKGRNPQTGQPMDIPARNAVKFRPGDELKKAVNG